MTGIHEEPPLTKTDRNARAVELWLQSRSWRSIAHHLEAEGFGAVSHQYVSRVVKRELQRAWEDRRSPVMAAVASAMSPAQSELVQAPSRMATAPFVASPEPARPAAASAAPYFELQVESFFSARHFVVMEDTAGTPHHHSYRVGVRIGGELDQRTGAVVGFAEASQALERAIEPYAEAFLNTLDRFERQQPTTENLAQAILEGVREQLKPLPCSATQLTLWESPTKGVTLNAA
jgi:6-pyruvoyl-tetrahydropterin synthase